MDGVSVNIKSLYLFYCHSVILTMKKIFLFSEKHSKIFRHEILPDL